MQSKVAFVYSSQGAQWPGMGLQLYRKEPVFRRVIEACSQVIEDSLGWSLNEEFLAGGGAVHLHSEADRIQPAVTALQIAFNEIFFDHGFWPAAVAGLSMGEPAACHAAGILCLKDAMAIACCQASLTRYPLRPGRMAMVSLSVSGLTDVLPRVAEDCFSIAAELSPTLTVISGRETEIHDTVSRLEVAGIRCSMVPINFAFHSPEVLPLREPFMKLFAPIKLRNGTIPIYSSVTGEVREGAGFDRDYWWRIFRDRAKFLSASKLMLQNGCRVFLEIGPHPTVLGFIAETAASVDSQIRTVSCMQRDADELATLQASLDAVKRVGTQIE